MLQSTEKLDFFMKKDYIFSLWSAQRITSWSPRQTARFVTDSVIKNALEGRSLEIDSQFVLLYKGVNAGQHEYVLYDGQQRTTALTIASIALLSHVKNNPSGTFDQPAFNALARLHPASMTRANNAFNTSGAFSYIDENGEFNLRLSLERTAKDDGVNKCFFNLHNSTKAESTDKNTDDSQKGRLQRNFIAVVEAMEKYVKTNEDVIKVVDLLENRIKCIPTVVNDIVVAGKKFNEINSGEPLDYYARLRGLLATNYNNSETLLDALYPLDTHNFLSNRTKLYYDVKKDRFGSDMLMKHFVKSHGVDDEGEAHLASDLLKGKYATDTELASSLNRAFNLWNAAISTCKEAEYKKLSLRMKIILSFIYRIGTNGNDETSLALAFSIDRAMASETDHELAKVFDVITRYFYSNLLANEYKKNRSLGQKLFESGAPLHESKTINSKTLASNIKGYLCKLTGSDIWPEKSTIEELYTAAFFIIETPTLYKQVLQDIFSYTDADVSAGKYALTRNFSVESGLRKPSSLTAYKNGIVHFAPANGTDTDDDKPRARCKLGTFAFSNKPFKDKGEYKNKLNEFFSKDKSEYWTNASPLYKKILDIVDSDTFVVDKGSESIAKLQLDALLSSYGRPAEEEVYVEPAIKELVELAFSENSDRGTAFVGNGLVGFKLTNNGLVDDASKRLDTYALLSEAMGSMKEINEVMFKNDFFISFPAAGYVSTIQDYMSLTEK